MLSILCIFCSTIGQEKTWERKWEEKKCKKGGAGAIRVRALACQKIIKQLISTCTCTSLGTDYQWKNDWFLASHDMKSIN